MSLARLIASPGFFYRRDRASGPIASLVEHSWVIEAATCRTAVEAALPDTSVEICFNLGPKGRQLVRGAGEVSLGARVAWVLGPRSRTVLVGKEVEDCSIVGLRLQPGAAALILGVPVHELRGMMVDLDQLWGPLVSELHDRLSSAPDGGTRMRILEREIGRRLALAGPEDEWRRAQRVCQSLEHSPPARVGVMARELGCSHRRLIALFDHHVGLKPKEYQRIQRFRQVLLSIKPSHQPWARIAANRGYFDQAHLINEFRALSGVTPGQYEGNHSPIGIGFMPHRAARPLMPVSSP